MIELLILLVIVAAVIWFISILPLPTTPIPFKMVLYVLVGLVVIVYLLRIMGGISGERV